MLTPLFGIAHGAWRRGRVFAAAHRVITTLILLALAYGGYTAYGAMTSSAGATSYTTAVVATSTVVSTLSESGQISATSDVSVSAQAAGTVLAIYVKPGTHVAAGTAIAKIDPTDALQTLRDAELSLETAQLTYEENTAAATALELLQAQNAVTNAQITLDKTRDTSYASIASIYTDLSTVISSLDSVLHDSNIQGRSNQQNIDALADLVANNDTSILIYKTSAATSYTAAVTAYNDALTAYKATPRSASNDELITLAQKTYTTAQTIADAVKNTHDFLDRVKTDYTLYNLDSSSTLASLISSVSSDTTIITGNLSSVLAIKSNIISAEQSLAVAEDTLKTTKEGPDELALKSAALTLKKAQETVTTAQEALADTVVRAPFSGTVASIAVDEYQTVGSGTNVATMVSDTKVAALSVSEADAVSIKPGQKVTITFDALPDVTIAGTVVSTSAAGSVSSGVVSYTVDVSLDTDNEDVKPGMSVTADIIVDAATGLVVPASAVKTAGSENYVLVFDPALDTSAGSTVTDRTPTRITVTTGITDGANTIILSGLTGGEQVVTKTSSISSSSTSKTTTTGTRTGMGGGMGVPGL